MFIHPFHLVLSALAHWANREQAAVIDHHLWCNPSRQLPCHPHRLHSDWRWSLACGSGNLMDWIGHQNDIADWGLGI